MGQISKANFEPSKPNPTRGNLTISFAHIVTHIKPQWFVIENVDRITHTQTLKDILSLFKKHNYGLTSLDIKNF